MVERRRSSLIGGEPGQGPAKASHGAEHSYRGTSYLRASPTTDINRLNQVAQSATSKLRLFCKSKCFGRKHLRNGSCALALFQTFGRANKEEPAHFQFTSMLLSAFQCQIYRNMAAKLALCSCITYDFLNLVRFHNNPFLCIY